MPWIGGATATPIDAEAANGHDYGHDCYANLEDPDQEVAGEGFFKSLVVGTHSKIADLWSLRHVQFTDSQERYTNDELLAGFHVHKAFEGSKALELDKDLPARVARKATVLAQQHPVPILGRFGQGKSSLINSLLGEQKAEHGRHNATTMGVEVYRMNAGLCGDILLFDTQGWEQGKTRVLLDQYQEAVLKETGASDLLPDVIIFVVAGTPQGLRELSNVIEGKHLAKAYSEFRGKATDRGTLLPVITFADATPDGTHADDAAQVKRKLEETIQRRGNNDMDVLYPAYVSNASGAGVDELRERIIQEVRNRFQIGCTSKTWHRVLQDELATEVQNMEHKYKGRCEAQVELVQRTIVASGYAHGKDTQFTNGMWHLMPPIRSKLNGSTTCLEFLCDCVYVHPCCFLLSPFVLLFMIMLYAYLTVDSWAGAVGGAFSASPPPGVIMDPTPTDFGWDMSGLTSGMHVSPLFDRAGVSDLQMAFDADAKRLWLMAPDGTQVEAELFLGKSQGSTSGTFPIASADAGLDFNFTDVESYTNAGVKLRQAMAGTIAVSNRDMSMHWPVTNPSEMGANFDLAGVTGMQFKFSGAASSPTGPGQVSSLQLCAPDLTTIHYRLYVDDISRTFQHTFHDQETMGFDDGQDCHGSADFAHAKTSYGSIGVEIFSAKVPPG